MLWLVHDGSWRSLTTLIQRYPIWVRPGQPRGKYDVVQGDEVICRIYRGRDVL